MLDKLKQLARKVRGLWGVDEPATHAVERLGLRSAPERLLVIANSVMPTVRLGIVLPLRELVDGGQISIEFLTEEQLKCSFGKAVREPEAAAWFKKRLAQSGATKLVFCRYSGPFAKVGVEFARAQGIATLYVIDDDLLNVPHEIGQAKFEYHNHPLRLDAVRFLLENSDRVYCSNMRLAERLRSHGIEANFFVGDVFCAGTVIAAPRQRPARKMGYMGFDHEHDFKVALPAVVRAMREFPDLQFELFGKIPRPPELLEFGVRVVQLPVVQDYESFLSALAEREWDVGICPLARTPFNEVKNINKWIEYTSVGTAVVATAGMIYDECCAEGAGLLVDDDQWEEALYTLLVDTERRVRQIKTAQDKLKREYSLDRLRSQWRGLLESQQLQSGAGV